MLSLQHSPGRRHHEAGRGDPPPLRRVCQPPEDERDQGRPVGVFNVSRGLSRGIRIRGLYGNQQRGQVWRVTWVQSFLLKFIEFQQATDRFGVCQLSHNSHDFVEEKQPRGTRLQCMRTILQTSQCCPTPYDEKGRNPDEKTKAQDQLQAPLCIRFRQSPWGSRWTREKLRFLRRWRSHQRPNPASIHGGNSHGSTVAKRDDRWR